MNEKEQFDLNVAPVLKNSTPLHQPKLTISRGKHGGGRIMRPMFVSSTRNAKAAVYRKTELLMGKSFHSSNRADTNTLHVASWRGRGPKQGFLKRFASDPHIVSEWTHEPNYCLYFYIVS